MAVTCLSYLWMILFGLSDFVCVCVTQMEFLTFNIVDSDVCASARTVALVTFIHFVCKKKGNGEVDCWHMFFENLFILNSFRDFYEKYLSFNVSFQKIFCR